MDDGIESPEAVPAFAAGNAGRATAAVLLVVVASAVVGVAAGGNGLLVPPVAPAAGWMRFLRVAGAIAAIGGMLGLLIRGRKLIAEGDPDFDTTGSALAAAVTIMSVIALLAFLAPRIGFARNGGSGDPTAGRSGEVGEARPGLSTLPPMPGSANGAVGQGQRDRRSGTGGRLSRRVQPGEPGGAGTSAAATVLERVGNGILLVVLFLAAVVGFRILTGRRVEEDPYVLPGEDDEPPVAAVDAEAGLLASLGDVAYEGRDPREQITVAYRRLLYALAVAGAPREPHEAPHEYMLRALGPLGVRPEPMHRLTELYVLAQFSGHPITERHRARAVEALEAGLS
ncbi:MAG: DUF4129 domain-containing protein, partial [Gemmatimonadota bacterium]